MSALFSLIAMLALVAAQDSGPREPVVTNPRWDQMPPPELAYPEYPPLATILGVGGDVHLRCIARVDGAIGDCEVLLVSTPGWGFEAAAIRVVVFLLLVPLSAFLMLLAQVVVVHLCAGLHGGSGPRRLQTFEQVLRAYVLRAVVNDIAVENDVLDP